MKILFDTCVMIDILQNRAPYAADAIKLHRLAAAERFTGLLTAKSMTDIYYVVRKTIGDEPCRRAMGTLCQLYSIADTTADDIMSALASGISDYEDAVMMATAARVKADYIVTRNMKDYARSSVPVLGPAELVRLMEEAANTEME